jgi:hypothetical protein
LVLLVQEATCLGAAVSISTGGELQQSVKSKVRAAKKLKNLDDQGHFQYPSIERPVRSKLQGALEPDLNDSIPSNLLFNHAINLLTVPFGHNKSSLRNNVWHTMQQHPGATTSFFDDQACVQVIAFAHSEELAALFTSEKLGCYRSDLCRLAMLYVHGGLYFDNDMEVLVDVRKFIPAGASLISALPQVGIKGGINAELDLLQAFLAATPGHPVLKRAMDMHLDWYRRRTPGETMKRASKEVLLGPTLLGRALREWLGVKKLHAGSNHKKDDSSAIAYLFQEATDVEKYGLTKRKGHECRKQGGTQANFALCNACIVPANSNQAIAWTRIANGAEYEGGLTEDEALWLGED